MHFMGIEETLGLFPQGIFFLAAVIRDLHHRRRLIDALPVPQTEEKLAVESGYWFNFRYNPTLAAEGKDAFSLDSKAPSKDYQEFLKGENRYASLAKFNPARAAELFAISEQNSKDRYEYLQKLVALYKAD